MPTSVSVNINLPKSDIAFIRKLGRRMKWTISEPKDSDALYDPESGAYLNEETMQAIHDVENGNSKKCNSIDDIFAEL